MNSDEIRAAVERLKEIPCDDTPFSLYSVAGAFMDMEMNGPYDSLGLRNRLIGLLEQADPDTHMELSRDADGEYVHIGDLMECDRLPNGNRVCGEVKAIGNGVVWLNNVQYFIHAKYLRHHKPTVEDILHDFAIACEDAGNVGPAVAVLAGKYADRLREVMADE